MKAAVIYRSKYGSTKRYAEWIAQDTGADLFTVSEFDAYRLGEYDTIVFGSSVHTGRIIGADFITANWPVLQNKRVVVFTASGAPSDSPGQIKVLEASLPEDICKQVKYFPQQGAYDYNKLDLVDKLLMNGVRMKLVFEWLIKGDKKARKHLDSFHVPQDWTRREAVNPVIEYMGACRPLAT